jgi:hypothetical protein
MFHANRNTGQLLATPRSPMDTTNPPPPKQSLAIAVPTAVLIVAATAVILRFYTRYAVLRNIGVDDWAVALTYVISPHLFLLCVDMSS